MKRSGMTWQSIVVIELLRKIAKTDEK